MLSYALSSPIYLVMIAALRVLKTVANILQKNTWGQNTT
jgi:hypothetical protein